MIAIVVILFIMGTGCLILDQQDKNRKLEKQNKELQTTVDLLKAGQEAMQNDQRYYNRTVLSGGFFDPQAGSKN